MEKRQLRTSERRRFYDVLKRLILVRTSSINIGRPEDDEKLSELAEDFDFILKKATPVTRFSTSTPKKSVKHFLKSIGNIFIYQ